MIVVDASAVIEVLMRTSVAARIERTIFAPQESLHVPHLLDLEVAHVLRRYQRTGRMDDDRGAQALDDLLSFPLDRYPHDIFLERIWALRENLTAYDAAYVSLAEALDAPLITRDARLASSSGHEARIELIG